MQLITEILKENSRYNVNRIVKMVEENPALIKELVTLTLQKDFAVPMRAAWILTHCHDAMPELLQPYIRDLIMASPGFLHTGTRRSVLRILSFEQIPEDLQVFIFDHCLQWVISKKEPVAVKVFAMEILANLAEQEPDLKNEVIPLILEVMPHGSKAFHSRGKRVLKKLGFREEDY